MKKWGMKVGGCVLGGSENIGGKEDHKLFFNRYPWIHQLMMSLLKAKTGKHIHVNYWGIINWTPILHTKASLQLTHPPPYHQSILIVFTSSLSPQYYSAELNWVASLLWKIWYAKSATITSILSHLQKKEREESKLSVKPPSILRTFVCLHSSSSSWEDSRGSVGLGLNRRGNIFTGYTKRELPFEISICIWKGKNGSFELVSAWVPDHFIYISCVLSYIVSDSSIQWVTSTFKWKVTWNIKHIAERKKKKTNSTWECKSAET